MKRAIDVACAASGLLIFGPALLLAMIAVRLESRGPAIFTQVRVGMSGTPFTIYKLRTMRTSMTGADITADGDARITRIGHVLRRTKIDELPQLLNVLRGDMSLVGPRPEIPSLARLWGTTERSIILSVHPGMTDPAAIKYRHEQTVLAAVDDPQRYETVVLPDKVSIYVDYVRNRSLRRDAQILLDTLKAVATG